MPLILDSAAPDFPARFQALLAQKREQAADVAQAVAAIIADVRAGGDAALARLTERFDRVTRSPGAFRLGQAEIAAQAAAADPAARAALAVAAARIEAFHRRQKPDDLWYTDETGAQLGHRWTPVAAAALYVPGGKAAYPSSVLMNAIPARVAGVPRLVMTVPVPDGVMNPLVAAAAELLGIDEVYALGGAQAIAALAYGTASIAPVDKIVGPGNAYVAAAKRAVFGQVGIDSIAGPSEILVIADRDNDPEWIAADLLSQAEHDEVAQAILLTDDVALVGAVAAAMERALAAAPRAAVAGPSWRDFGAIIRVQTMDEAPALADALAAEHLEILTSDPQALAARIRNAGAIFLGPYTPEAIGDYVAGPNHVLPTGRSARFSSGLSVLDFMKRTSLVALDRAAFAALGPAAMALAEAEGLAGHARAIALRLAPKRS